MRDHIIELRELNYVYPDGHKALSNISFKIKKGESVGIVGGNASGKTTLLMLLAGMLTPTSGSILIGDVLINQNSLPVARRHMGVVMQNSDEQLFLPTVYDDVAFDLRKQNGERGEQEIEQMVSDALEKVDMPYLMDRSSFKLSGGEKRCVALACALAASPEILVMDEPTSGLDSASRERVIEIVSDLKYTKIIAGFDVDMINKVCERIIVLKDGEMVADKKTEDFFSDIAFMDECSILPTSFSKKAINRTDTKSSEVGGEK